ncbi:MAG TPA: sulfotransferase domain-containing protein [Gallionella sp.]|nr:sulfotransferase domain-containing protein [Gallionella sp.]
MKVVWLASYPKSGNTFARMLLHTYLYGKSQNSEEIAGKIPDIHQILKQNKSLVPNEDSRVLVKTHFCLTADHPYAEVTTGYIYILRNPRDVLLSNARYLGVDGNPDSLRKFALSFINDLGVPRWRQMKMGSWPEHLASWLNSANRLPHIFIKYEDLRMDTANTLKRVISFLGEEPEDSRIQMAVNNCTLEKAKKFEVEEKRQGRKRIYVDLPNNASFVGEGRIAQSLAGIGEDVESLYQERFGRLVSIFGY